MLNIFGWESLKEQRVKAKAKIMFKTLNNMGSMYFQERNIESQSPLQLKYTIRVPKPNTNKEKEFYLGQSIHI